ncbi:MULTISPECIES: hypothetical protein, partial [Variovorax]|uniref:hypothetical protein n=1 Tax=Variovorax TaxID=34072 RepID=UPI001C4318AA
DDSAGSRVKVGHRQALTAQKPPVRNDWGFLLLEFANIQMRRNKKSPMNPSGFFIGATSVIRPPGAAQ